MRVLDPIAVPLRGAHLIEASAGTGKTYTITTLILRLIVEAGFGIDEILVVTYTRAATGELRDRIRRRLDEALSAVEGLQRGEPIGDVTLAALWAQRQAATLGADVQRLRAALRALDEAAIFTIHGFCQRALSEWAFESGLPLQTELTEEPWALLSDVVRDFWANHAYDAEPTRVHYWNANGAGVEALGKVARRVTANPNLHVVPERPPLSEVVGTADFEARRDELAAMWSAEREVLIALLTTGDDLSRNSYKVDTILSKWLPELDRARQWRAGSVPKFVERLTPAGLKAKTRKNRHPPAHPFFRVCDAVWSESERVGRALGAQAVGLRLELGQHAGEALSARKRERGLLGFDDLLRHLDEALQGPHGPKLAARIAARYRVGLIDEFQDTDPMQYRIFRRIYGGSGAGQGTAPLFLIGDPKQAIYGFRGADVFAYLEAAADVGDARHTLSVNYRSDPGVIAGLQALFAPARQPFVFDAIAFHPVSAAPDRQDALCGPDGDQPLQWLWLSHVELGVEEKRATRSLAMAELPTRVAAEVARLLCSDARIGVRPVEPRDIAILLRTNQQSRNTQRALRALGIPAVLEGDDSVFDSEMAEELTRVLAALAQPGEQAAVRAALSTSMLGLDAPALDALRHDEAAWDGWLERMHRWSGTWHERGFFPALHQLLAGASVQRRLLSLPDGERRLTDLLHLAELLHQAEGEQHLGPLSLLGFLRTMRLDADQRGQWTADSAQVRLESDARAVQLTTVHKSKGLEYPIVFCPFLWDGNLLFPDEKVMPRFHDPEHAGRNTLDLGSDAREAHVRLAGREALAEQLRLTYVALTRAKHRCYVVWGKLPTVHDSSLAYLLHQGPLQAGPELPGAVADRVKKMDAEALRQELSALVDAAGGAMGLRPIADASAPPYTAPAQSSSLRYRTLSKSINERYRVGSFSSLAQDAPPGADEPRPDHDAGTVDEALSLSAAPKTLVGPVVLAQFPAGARIGSMIHHVYEHIDFAADVAAVDAQTTASLQLFGMAPELSSMLAPAVHETLQVPIAPPGGSGPRLCEVPRADRIDELEFVLQVGHGRDDLTIEGLAAVLDAHGASSYAKRLRQLSAVPLTGFVRGYIDLLFRHEGRFYVVDYKSNRLGDDASDYAPARLQVAMLHHHYYLQYLLYVVATHRYLGARMPDYDYERHFGGVGYLFVRGMATHHPEGTGVFFDRPDAALVEALAMHIGGDSATRPGGVA